MRTSLRSRASRQEEEQTRHASPSKSSNLDTPIETPGEQHSSVPNKQDVKTATRKRFFWSLISSLFYLLSLSFLILVRLPGPHHVKCILLIQVQTIIGNINTKPVIRSTHIILLDLSQIIPASYGNTIVFANSIARSLGLYDFYTVGLWNYCAGYYNPREIIYCSSPKTLYWFNPVDILVSQLFAGATIVLPAEINDILRLVRIASQCMFGFFMVGACMNFISALLSPIVVFSRWISFPFAIWSFIAALLTTAAAVIATVMAVIFRNVATSQDELNIGASIGKQMFIFMWLGAGFSIIAWLINASMCCCCLSRRDIRKGGAIGCWCGARQKKRGRYSMQSVSEKSEARPGPARSHLPRFLSARSTP